MFSESQTCGGVNISHLGTNIHQSGMQQIIYDGGGSFFSLSHSPRSSYFDFFSCIFHSRCKCCHRHTDSISNSTRSALLFSEPLCTYIIFRVITELKTLSCWRVQKPTRTNPGPHKENINQQSGRDEFDLSFAVNSYM